MSRTKNSIINLACSLGGQILGLLANFISRIFFIKILGSEYLGLNGLFTNVLTLLSLSELGIGTAITYSLYKPLADKDEEKCKMLMQLYKKIYTIIGIVIFILGVVLIPVLPYLINDMPDNINNINLIYMLFVLNTAVSYLCSYKRNLIIADQKIYITNLYHYAFYILLNIVQIIYLVITKEYIGFLVLQVLSTFLENVFISKKADKMYPYLKEKDKIPLDKKTKKELVTNTKALMLHKVGGVVVNSTDNILISAFVGLKAVGLYSNYYVVIAALNLVYTQIYSSLTASVGNLCTGKDTEKEYNVFKKINFLTFWIYCFSAICLVTLFNPFITIWLGKDYLFGIGVVLVLAVNFYITGMRKSVLTFKEATGLFKNDQYKCIVEALINLVASIALALKFGVVGIFIGTLISSITACVGVEAYVLFKNEFKKSTKYYFKDYFKYLLITIILGLITYFTCNLVTGNIYLVFIIKTLICLSIPNLILLVLFRKTEEFNYFKDLIFSKLKKRKA